MLNESSVEFITLVNHIFKILLTHQGNVYLLEESLTSWVNLDRLLQFAEVAPSG